MTNEVPKKAIAKNGRPYGYWCCKRRHVWNRAEDAEKCCHPNWSRALSVRPGSSFAWTYSEMDEAERCPECGYTDADARRLMDHHLCNNYPFFTKPGGYEDEAPKVLASTTSEADESFPPFGWRIDDTCLELTFRSQREAVSALNQLHELRRTGIVTAKPSWRGNPNHVAKK